MNVVVSIVVLQFKVYSCSGLFYPETKHFCLNVFDFARRVAREKDYQNDNQVQ